MSFDHKIVLWVMQRLGYLVILNKRQNFFHTLLVCSKADFRSANLTSEVIFVNEILRVATSTNACELVVCFKTVTPSQFHETFLIFSGAIKSSPKFLKVQSALPRSGSLL